MIAAAIERRVREAWAKVERENPGVGGLIYALIPVSQEFTLSDIPKIEECVRVELERAKIGSHEVIGLKFIKEAGR